MTRLRNPTTRGEVFQFISHAASYGNLGLFVGAGLSKAVLNEHSEIALSWGRLLEGASEKLGIPYSSVVNEGFSYPQIATSICHAYSTAKHNSFSSAVKALKSAIADLTSWYPDQDRRELFGKYLRALTCVDNDN